MRVEGKVIVVTGAGSGIGRELSLQLLQKGASVVAVDYNADALEETRSLAGDTGRLSTHVVDVSAEEQVHTFVANAIEAHGYVDGLINNAGIIQPFASVVEMPVPQMRRVIDVNWWGVVYLMKALLPHLIERPEAHIVNISSMGGLLPFPHQVVYGASKAAVKLITEGLIAEMKGSAVNVSVVYPGAVQTDIASNAPNLSADARRKLADASAANSFGVTARKAAATIISGMETNRPRILIGADCRIIDKLYRLAPVTTTRLMAWLVQRTMGADLSVEVQP